MRNNHLCTFMLCRWTTTKVQSNIGCETKVVNMCVQQIRKGMQPQESRTLYSHSWKHSCSICTLSDGAAGGCGGVRDAGPGSGHSDSNTGNNKAKNSRMEASSISAGFPTLLLTQSRLSAHSWCVNISHTFVHSDICVLTVIRVQGYSQIRM